MSIYNDITIIIVCYKSHDLIKKNLNALKVFKTIIVDNSNCIKTYNLVKNYDNITLIKTSKNLGYGKANNIGVANANTKFILILNPDILVDEKSIIALYNKKDSYDNIGILVPSLFSKNNVHQNVILIAAHLRKIKLSEYLNQNKSNKNKIILLDQLSDPQNIGSIIRSALAFGFNAVGMLKNNSPFETSALIKASSGEIEKITLIELGNLINEINLLKQKGFFVSKSV